MKDAPTISTQAFFSRSLRGDNLSLIRINFLALNFYRKIFLHCWLTIYNLKLIYVIFIKAFVDIICKNYLTSRRN